LPPNIGYIPNVKLHKTYIAMLIGAMLSKGTARVTIFGE